MAVPADHDSPLQKLRVLLIDDGARHIQPIRDELVRQGHEVVGVIASATLIHDVVQQLQPDVVIVDSESPTRDTLENLATLSAHNPRPVVVFTDDDSRGADAARAARRRERLCDRRSADRASRAGAAGRDRALRAGGRAARAARTRPSSSSPAGS